MAHLPLDVVPSHTQACLVRDISYCKGPACLSLKTLPSKQTTDVYIASSRLPAGLADICHKHSVPLIVDEAHGAHLGLLPDCPASAMQQGADIAVQSTHKTLSALGQASMLHCRGDLVSTGRLSQSLRLLQVESA